MKLSYRISCFILIPVVLLPVALVKITQPLLCLYMLIVMAAFWALDVLPYGVTSLIPILFAPLMGITASKTISVAYSSDSLMLCLGRLILACAFQRQQIHRRFGLYLLTKFGPQPRMIMLACMLPSYILTMFISNTATAPIMLEFVVEILQEINDINEGKGLQSKSKSLTSYVSGEVTPLISRHNMMSYSKDNPNFDLNDEYPSMTNVVEKPKLLYGADIASSINSNPSGNPRISNFPLALSLGTGYAASSGAVATMVASGPNLILYGILLNLNYVNGFNYGTFIAVGLPLSVVTFILTWLWVGIANIGPRQFFKIRKNTPNEDIFQERMVQAKENLGKMSFGESSCIFLTALVIILWITRSLTDTIGWGYAFTKNGVQNVSDATPMMLIIVLIYIWPSKLKFWQNDNGDPGSERLLPWDVTHKNLPWAIIFLLGTGFAITNICHDSGFSDIVGEYLEGIEHVSIPGLVIICSILACVTTEFLSSTTILPVYISIFIKLACRMRVHPYYFVFPITLSSSFAFCLPAATTPNIAIFNRGLATTRQMIKTGIVMDIVFIFIVTAFTYISIVPIFNMRTVPSWFSNCTRPN